MNDVWAVMNTTGVWTIFFEILLLLLSLTFLILGILTAYFGSGKSRAAGITLSVIGIIIPLAMYFIHWIHEGEYFTNDLLLPGLIYIGGALVGVIIGFLVFLGLIMKT